MSTGWVERERGRVGRRGCKADLPQRGSRACHARDIDCSVGNGEEAQRVDLVERAREWWCSEAGLHQGARVIVKIIFTRRLILHLKSAMVGMPASQK